MNKYQEAKERARNEAIEWQLEQCDKALPMLAYLKKQAHFENLGKRYGLTKEFRENGII